MKINRTCNIERIIYSFKRWLLLNKNVLIKSFLNGALHDHSKLTYLYLSEKDKDCKCYSCLKLMIQAHLHVVFLKIFFIKFFHFNDSVEISSYCNQAQFLNKEISWNWLVIEFFAWNFLQLPIKKSNCNSVHSYNRKIWVDIPLILQFMQ